MQFDIFPMLGFVGLLHPQLNDLNHNLNHSTDSKLSYNMKNEKISENGYKIELLAPLITLITTFITHAIKGISW